MYHAAFNVKKETEEEVKGLVTSSDKCASSVDSLALFVADCGALREHEGASQPVCPRLKTSAQNCIFN